MRLAIVVTPALSPDERPTRCALDGDVVRARLPLPDTDFRLVDLDPAKDLAEQLDELFDAQPPRPDEPILFYASSVVVLAADGELLLCVDLAQPTGDALSEIVAVVSERARGPVLFVLECIHAVDPEDPFHSTAVVVAGKAAVSSKRTGIELLIAARPLDHAPDDLPSPFTRALLEGLNDCDQDSGVTAASLYNQIRESEVLVGLVPCFAHAFGKASFELIAPSPDATRRPEEEPEEEQPSDPEQNQPDPDQEQLDLDQARLDSDQARLDSDQEQLDLDRARLASAQARLDSAQEQLDSDQEQLDSDQARLDTDEEPTETDEERTETDEEPADTDEDQAVRDEEPADQDEDQADQDEDQAVRDEDQAVRDEDQAVRDEDQADQDEDQADQDEDQADQDEDQADPDQDQLEAEQTEQPEDEQPEEDQPADERELAAAAVDAGPVTTASQVPPAPVSIPGGARSSFPPHQLPESRSFQKVEPALPKVILSDRAPRQDPEEALRRETAASPTSGRDAASYTSSTSSTSSLRPASASTIPPPVSPGDSLLTVADCLAASDALITRGEDEGALVELKRALGILGGAASPDRIEIFLRIGEIRRRQDRRREAISNFDKVLKLDPTRRGTLEVLLELNIAEGDWRAVQDAEDRLLALITDTDERFLRLLDFGRRWDDVVRDPARALSRFERARSLMPDDLEVLGRLATLYEAGNRIEEMVTTRHLLAELTLDPRERASRYSDLAQFHLFDLLREEQALELFEAALDSDPTLLEPLEIVASILADRQEWGQLELAYRRMLERIEQFTKGAVRSEVTWELCRRIGLLYRDHLEDPALALDAFEDALEAKPDDLGGHVIAADLAKSTGNLEVAATHLAAVAALEPRREKIYLELFEVFQRQSRLDEAYCAASVSVHLGVADDRQRIIHDEHRTEGVPKLRRALRPEAWDLLGVRGRDRNVEAILAAITPAAIEVKLAQLAAEGRMPALDPASRQDPEQSTISVVRSLTWASHFLGIPAPAVYVREDAPVGLAAMTMAEPTAVAGASVLRGRGLLDLAFLVGRHLSYHVEAHKLLIFYPSIEELSACFVAAVKIGMPLIPVPKAFEPAVKFLLPKLEALLGEEDLTKLERAAQRFDAAGTRADLRGWVAAVERSATRTGYLLCGDLGVAEATMRADPRGVVSVEDRLADLYGFAVSEAHHTLRQELGIALRA